MNNWINSPANPSNPTSPMNPSNLLHPSNKHESQPIEFNSWIDYVVVYGLGGIMLILIIVAIVLMIIAIIEYFRI